jgi:cell division protein FtsB
MYRSSRVSNDVDDRRTSRRPARHERRRGWRRIGRVLLVVVSTVMVVDAVVGERGLLATLRARDEHQALAMAIERQRLENRRLREDARRLTEDPSAIEEIARRELGLIRPGEKVFILRDLSPAAARP